MFAPLATNSRARAPEPRRARPPPSGCNRSCYVTETTANNFIALRYMPGSARGDLLYAQFQTGDQGEEDIDFSQVQARPHGLARERIGGS